MQYRANSAQPDNGEMEDSPKSEMRNDYLFALLGIFRFLFVVGFSVVSMFSYYDVKALFSLKGLNHFSFLDIGKFCMVILCSILFLSFASKGGDFVHYESSELNAAIAKLDELETKLYNFGKSQREPIDVKPIENKLEDHRKAINDITKQLDNLVKISSSNGQENNIGESKIHEIREKVNFLEAQIVANQLIFNSRKEIYDKVKFLEKKLGEEFMDKKILTEVKSYIDNKLSDHFQKMRKQQFDVNPKQLDDLLKSKFKEYIDKLFELYSADRIGMVDYAFYSSGGRVIMPMTTQISRSDLDKFYLDHQQVPKAQEKKGIINRFLNVFVKKSDTPIDLFPDPTNVIKQSLQPGDCWAFLGHKGQVTIKLSKPIRISHITIDHTHRLISHQMNSAPKQFNVWGWRLDLEGKSLINQTLIAEGMYNTEKNQIQTFPAKPSNEIYSFVTLEILTNYGNPDYTCVYRFRVHSEI